MNNYLYKKKKYLTLDKWLKLCLLVSVATSLRCERDKAPSSPSVIKDQRLSPIAGQGTDPNRTQPFTIGVLYWSMNIPGQVAMRNGLESTAEAIQKDAEAEGMPGISLVPFVAGDGEEGMERQIMQMKSLIEQRVDLIIVQPTDIAALSNALKLANNAGIPVVAYDQHILGGNLACFLTSDNYQAGFLDGEYVAANFPDVKRLRIILVEYPHVSSTVSRVNGFIDALEKYGQAYDILQTYSAVEPVSGALAGSAILRDFPQKGSVDVVFAVNDGGGLSVVSVLEEAGRNEIFFASVDGDPASVENIRQGGISRIDSAQFCSELGSESMKAAWRLLRGEEVGELILIPVFPITRETVEMYHGWTAPVPEPFEKPWPSFSPIWSGKVKVITSEAHVGS